MKKLLILLLIVLFAPQCVKADSFYYTMRVGEQKTLNVNPSTFLYPHISSYRWDAPSIGVHIVSGGWMDDKWCTIMADAPSNPGDRYEVTCRVYEKNPGSVVETLSTTYRFYITVEGNSPGGGGGGSGDGQMYPCTGTEPPYVLDIFETYPEEGATVSPENLELSFRCNNDLRTNIYNPYSFIHLVDDEGKTYGLKRHIVYVSQREDGSLYSTVYGFIFQDPYKEDMGYTLIIPVKSLFNSNGEYNSNEFRLHFRTSSASSIRDVESKKCFDIYDLKGHLVKKQAESTQGLPKGVYIINKRKVIIQ